MKILKIHIENINSLSGVWNLDFTDDAFRDGLFAVIGETGSGKTTIFDALCLALFATTPRIEAKTGVKLADLISRNANRRGYAVASAEFLHGGVKYTASVRFTQAASANFKGNLQKGDQEAGNWTSPGKMRADMEGLLGSTFQQFTRTVLLAQGAFGKFLDAGEKEQTEILQNLTDTGIYSRICEKIKKRAEDARSAYEAQAGNFDDFQRTMMSPEEAADKQSRYARLTAEISTKKQRLAECGEELKRFEAADKAATEEAEAQQQLNRLLHSRQEFEPRRIRLQQAETAARVRTEYQASQQAAGKAAEAVGRLNEVSEALENAAVLRTAAEQALKAAQERIASQKEPHAQARAKIAAAVKLDGEIAVLEPECRKQENQVIAEDGDRRTQEGTIDAVGKNLEEQKKAHAESRRYLDEHGGDRPLAGLISRWQSAMQKIVVERSAVDGARQRLQDARKNLESAQSRVESAGKACSDAGAKLKQTQDEAASKYARRNELCRQFTSENIDDLVKLRRQALEKARIASSKDLSALRAALADGDPCPLCGSPEHPYAAGNIPSASREEQALNEITALQEELATLGNDLGILEERERQQRNNLQQAEEEQKIAALQLTQCREALAQAEADFAEKSGSAAASVRALQTEVAGFGVVMSDDAAEIPAELRQRAEKFESAEKQLKIYGGNVEKLQADLQHHIAAKEAAEPRWQESRRTLEVLQRKLNELTGERKAILGASTTADAEDRLLEAEAAAARELERCRVELDDKQQSEKKLLDKKSGMEGDCTALALQAGEAAEALECKLRENRITLEQYKTWILEESELLKLTAERTELDTKTESAGKTLQAAQEKLQKAREALNPCITREEVSREADALRDGVEADNKNSGALQQALEEYQRQQNAMQERSAALLQAQKTFQYWDDFSRMVARGDRLADFAQQINLERLLRAANGYLNSLSKRYMLFREEGSEERETRNNHSIWVIDNHRGGEKRRSGNLSGGEKFLVSLALALGLGRLNSGSTPAENFFLDEGFGNLSGEALDNAINTLKNLKGDGKLVGVISHVREIAENINCRLLLRKKGNGISEIRGPGVTAVETAAPAKKKRRRRAAIPEAEDGTE